jgi:hypothetical protein
VSAVASAVQFDLVARTASRGTFASEPLSIGYDASTGTYSVSISSRSQTFTGATRADDASDPNWRAYVIAANPMRDVLQLWTESYSGDTGYQYVGFGYWQHDKIVSAKQDANFDFFTFGFPTPAASVPHSGFASWDIELFGIAAQNGEPLGFSGEGTFNVDFLTGDFSSDATLRSFNLATNQLTNGNGTFLASGRLGSGNSFSGTTLFNQFGSSGPIQGQFYGPGLEEVGATIIAINNRYGSDPAAPISGLTAVLTGKRNTNPVPVTLSLTHFLADLGMTSPLTEFGSGYNPTTLASTGNGVNAGFVQSGFENQKITFRQDGGFDFAAALPPGLNASFAPPDQISQTDRFTTFRKTINGTPTTLEVYRSGAGNHEIALSYVSFGNWATEGAISANNYRYTRNYFVFGLQTPLNSLANLTGTAHYDGVVHATGSAQGAPSFAVGGTSTFDFDFGMAKYSGALDLTRLAADGSVFEALGRWTTGNVIMTSGIPYSGGLTGPANHVSTGQILPRFYGPNMEELAAPFTIASTGFGGLPTGPNDIWIAGVTVAKKQ